MRIPHLSTSRHALDGDELIGEIRRRKRQLLSARLAGTLTWADLDEQDEFLAFWPPKLAAERRNLQWDALMDGTSDQPMP